jgi:hypothetical protein
VKYLKYQQLAEQGYDEQNSEIVSSELVSEVIYSSPEMDDIFKANEEKESLIDSLANNVCIKTTITSITLPFEFKVEMHNVCHKVPPFGVEICLKQPSTFRRNALYTTYSEICYPVDLILANVEKCAKQAALAGVVAATSGNFAAAGAAVQAAFLACMVFSDANDANKITVRVAGEKETSEWKPV